MGFNRGIGRPKIKTKYGSSTGDVKANINRKLVKGGVKLRTKRVNKGIKNFGFSFN
jgi:hypothetical protein